MKELQNIKVVVTVLINLSVKFYKTSRGTELLLNKDSHVVICDNKCTHTVKRFNFAAINFSIFKVLVFISEDLISLLKTFCNLT